VAGYTWSDVGRRLPFDQFVSFVMHSPPGTAVYNERHGGWTVTDHLVTDLLELTDLLLACKTKDPQKTIRKLKPRFRPNAKPAKRDAAQVMTVADYVKRTGMVIELGGD
jgi:hypothetical protein